MHARSSKLLLLCLALLLSLGAGACQGQGEGGVELAPASLLSPRVLSAPHTVQEAYRFALANPHIMQQIPCYCGCGAVGHRSNYDCYVAAIEADGEILFDDHALG
jgi:hypothetical protein